MSFFKLRDAFCYRYDIQYNKNQNNNTQRKELICDAQHK